MSTLSGANGYLIDQFLQVVSNKRTDEYGGSVENRTRFALEVVDAVVAAVGAERTAIRFSPWSPFQGASHRASPIPYPIYRSTLTHSFLLVLLRSTEMGMADPLPTFSHVIAQIALHHPKLAYLHLVEPRINGNATRDASSVGTHESNDGLRALWAPRPFVRAGGFTRAGALEAAEAGDLIAFGRLYISNVRPSTRSYFLVSN
jgi:NADPH2 dehydrogenase